jgi:hypothetical protein
MQKLDRLGWAAGMAFTSFGVRIGVRTTDPSVLPEIEAALPPGWKPTKGASVSHMFSVVAGGAGHGKGVRKMWIAYDGWVRTARAREPEPVMDALGSAIRMTVAEHAPKRIFVHAGCVAWRGKAILIPGRSFSGKTTLVSELVKAGAIYYSDEYAVLDPRGLVHPFPAPLSVRESGEFVGTDRHPADFGGVAGSKPLPVGVVLVTSYKAGKEGARWRPRALSAAEGALELLANTVAARTRPEAALATLKAATHGAEILKGKRGEASETAAALIARLEG